MAKKVTEATRWARATERDLVRLRDQVEKCALAIGYRFGDIDGVMVSEADALQRTVNLWIDDQRKYMAECVDHELWSF